MHFGHAAVPRSRTAANLHPWRDFRRHGPRWSRAPGDQSGQFPPEACAGAARSPQLLARQVRSGQRSQSLPVCEEDPGLHEGRLRGSAEPALCQTASDTRPGCGREEMRTARHSRPSVRGALPGTPVSGTGGLRDLAEDARQGKGFSINTGAGVMRSLAISLLAALCGISCRHPADDFRPETVIALERGALDRWGKGDPQGFLDIMASDQTYFDPTTAKRLDGQDMLKKYFAPFIGKI